MNRNLSVFAFSLLFLAPLHAADAPSAAEARLRESLKNTMLQLRTAETERSALQAAQVESDAKNKELAAKVADLTKKCADDKDKAEKALAALNAQLAERDAQLGELQKALEQWKGSQKQAADLANTKEGERAKLAAEILVFKRRVADQQTKNAAMFKIGNEILTRYEKFGLGEALTAREPFVGTTRVKLQNLIQDYRDNLADQRIKP